MIKVGDTVAYDLRELSQKLSVSERTLRQYIKDGKLQAFKLGLKYYVTQRALDEYFNTPSVEWKSVRWYMLVDYFGT
jgi:excisionase family DNA binding protein